MLINFNRDPMKYLKINMQMNEFIVPAHPLSLLYVEFHIFMLRCCGYSIHTQDNIIAKISLQKNATTSPNQYITS